MSVNIFELLLEKLMDFVALQFVGVRQQAVLERKHLFGDYDSFDRLDGRKIVDVGNFLKLLLHTNLSVFELNKLLDVSSMVVQVSKLLQLLFFKVNDCNQEVEFRTDDHADLVDDGGLVVDCFQFTRRDELSVLQLFHFPNPIN